MPRATFTEVRVILPAGSQLTNEQLNQSIDAATCVVDKIALGCASGLTEDCLKQVEIYLSAHYAAATENTLSLSSETDACSDSKKTYGFAFGKGIYGTQFGQMANTLSGGCLAEQDKQPARLFSIGCQ